MPTPARFEHSKRLPRRPRALSRVEDRLLTTHYTLHASRSVSHSWTAEPGGRMNRQGRRQRECRRQADDAHHCSMAAHTEHAASQAVSPDPMHPLALIAILRSAYGAAACGERLVEPAVLLHVRRVAFLFAGRSIVVAHGANLTLCSSFFSSPTATPRLRSVSAAARQSKQAMEASYRSNLTC